MTVSNWTDLQSEIASNSNRSDLTARIPTFVQMAEAEMQRRLKLVDFEASATVAVTDGVGSLPADFAGHRAAYFDGDQRRPLSYITPDRYNALVNRQYSLPAFFTITGSTIMTMSSATGNVILTYNARFIPLSDSNATNAIITTYPDAYLFGSLKWLYHHMRNWDAKTQQAGEFERILNQIVTDMKDRKYPGPLEVRAR